MSEVLQSCQATQPGYCKEIVEPDGGHGRIGRWVAYPVVQHSVRIAACPSVPKPELSAAVLQIGPKPLFDGQE
jgi:hypothetical protein